MVKIIFTLRCFLIDLEFSKVNNIVLDFELVSVEELFEAELNELVRGPLIRDAQSVFSFTVCAGNWFERLRSLELFAKDSQFDVLHFI